CCDRSRARSRDRRGGAAVTVLTRPATRPASKIRVARRALVVREMGILLALVLLVGVTAATNPRFLSAQSIKALLLGSTILAILAVGRAIGSITRNVDLSVGSTLGRSAFGTGSLLVAVPQLPIPVVIVVGTAV